MASWRRAVLGGLRSDLFEPPYDADMDAGGRLTWAGASVIDRVGDDLQGTPIALLLTDHRGHVLARQAGNRAVASQLDCIQLAPGFIYGEQRIGTNAIGTAIEHRGASMVRGHAATGQRIGWEIEQRLPEDSSLDERVLREQFLRARRTARGLLIWLNERTMYANGAAAGIVERSDRELIWDLATRG